MALTKGAARKEIDLEEFPEVPDQIPRDQWDRPLITPLEGNGRPVAYTRASTLGKAIEDTYHLNRWTVRSVVLGMSRREELVARAAAIPENEGEHRGPLDKIGEEAKTAGGGDRGANIGTALHKLSERRDAGEDLSYLPPELAAAMDAYGAQMTPFKVLASETFVVCDPLQTAGSFDRVVQLLVDLEFTHRGGKGRIVLPAGTVLVLDLKTGKFESAKYWGAAYGVQQTVYACGVPYVLGEGRIEWSEILGEGLRPSVDWALILHVPSDQPQDAGLIIVDLESGAAMADLCLEIRTARKNKGLMSDAWPVKAATVEKIPVPQSAIDALKEPNPHLVKSPDDKALFLAGLLADIRRAGSLDELNALWKDFGKSWTDEHVEAAKTRAAEWAPEPVEPPAHVVKVQLMAKLRAASTEAELNGLWEIHQDVWTAEHTAMVRARMGEIGRVAS